MRDIITEIWSTARRNKLRTTLTGFAVAWGIFMIIVLLGAGNGLINAQLKQSDRFLASSMVVFGGETSKPYQGMKEGRSIRLQTRDISYRSHHQPWTTVYHPFACRRLSQPHQNRQSGNYFGAFH